MGALGAFLGICCLLGASVSQTAGEQGVWLAAGVALIAIAAFAP
jgi:hypothetical protein